MSRGKALTGPDGREAVGYDHGYDGEVEHLAQALHPAYVEGFVEGCLERTSAYLTDPNYATLRLRLELAHSAVEAATVEVRRRVRLNEGR